MNDSNFASLTPAQHRAVTSPLESRLVLAGPGTGKTRTLVHRVAYLIAEFHIPSEHILAVTYTNKATEEMRHRLRLMLPADSPRLNVGTFHAFCIRVLRQFYEAAGLPKHFAVTDEDGQLSVLQKVVPNLREKRDVRSLLGQLSTWRLSDPVERGELAEFQRETLANYVAALRKQALIDFDDILLLTEELFGKRADVLATVQAGFEAVLVDEFQDTDTLQYRILKQLTGGRTPVFAVADDDQSIFAWRGADPQNLRRFVQDFLPCDTEPFVIKLEENYRCSGPIVDAANRLIGTGLRLFDKVPTAMVSEGAPVKCFTYQTDRNEAEAVAYEIQKLVSTPSSGFEYRDTAVLYRNHRIGELIETVLLGYGVPCQVVRGGSLFDTPRVRQILALLRVQLNPQDEISLRQLLKENLDDLVLHKIEEFSLRARCSLRRALWEKMRAGDGTHVERRQISRIVGLLTTAKAIAENNPRLSLRNWVEQLNLYVTDTEWELPDGDLCQISDPLASGTLETAARWLERLAVRGGRLILTAAQPAVATAAALLLGRMLAGETFTVHTLDELGTLPDPNGKPNLLLALDPESEVTAAKRFKFIAVLAVHSEAATGPKSSLPRRDLPATAVPEPERGPEPSRFVLLWKLGQAYQGLRKAPFLTDYTVVDIETTDLDVERNDVVEVAAVRVRNGVVTEEFSSFVKPAVPISPGAEAVHHISAAMVATAPSFAEIAKPFREFLGQDTLVAHNGLGFDFPILIRLFKTAGLKMDNLCFDTLPMARELYPDAKKATLESLAAKFGVDPGSSHRALDDTRTLAQVFECMKQDFESQQRQRNGFESLGLLAVAMLLETEPEMAEEAPLFRLGKELWGAENTEDVIEKLIALLVRNQDRQPEDQPAAEVSARLRAVWREANQSCADDEEVRQHSHATEGYLRFCELLSRYEGRPLTEAMQEFLDFTRLFQQQDSWKERNAVTLMTIHAAKGLEFPYVWIVALEQNVLPTYQATKAQGPHRTAKIEEERRLLYVAMTRAQKQLTLSHARERNGYATEPSMFLEHLF
ncbi:MAG: UvrD-helicase domain-containing protein [Blastocatellia bacterium]|nr:UvrD-helicase domain-containing protein [Blastocatellia bacterium]